MKTWKKLIVFLLMLVLVLGLAAVPALADPDDEDEPQESVSEETVEADDGEEEKADDEEAADADDGEDAAEAGEEEGPVVLDLWEEDSEARKMLEEYVAAVTDPDGEEFIPEEDRIAVFDLDGTLFCETDPLYLEWLLYMKRALCDPDYEADKDDEELCRDIAAGIVTGKITDELEMRQIAAETKAFAGMHYDDYVQYVRDLTALPCFGYDNMTVGEAFYQPMVQVLRYLEDNGFICYVVSGSGRTFIRTVSEEALGLAPSQFIGSDTWVIASGMESAEEGGEYVYQEDDVLVLSDELVLKNVKTNKILQIMEHIGQKPVLSFGNSGSDLPMAEFVCWDNDYDAMAFMLLCDDTERENGKPEKAAKMEETCIDYGFVPISMKNDWKTIYGEDVTRREAEEIDPELSEEEAAEEMIKRLETFFNAEVPVKPQDYAAKIVEAYENGQLTESDLKAAILLLYQALGAGMEQEED